MGNKPKRLLPDMEVVTRARQAGREESQTEIETANKKAEAAKSIFEAAGKIKAMKFYESQSAFFKLIELKKVKDSREYYEKYGMTWAQFCEYCGINRRRIDEELQDLKPFRVDFLADFANFLNSDFNKIKYLGMNQLADSANSNQISFEISGDVLIYGDEKVPLNKEDLCVFLDRLEIAYKDQIKEQKKQSEKEIKAMNGQIQAIATEKEAMVKEINRLKAFEPKGADEEITQKLKAIDKHLDQVDELMRSFVFTADDLSDETFSRVAGICKRIRDRFELFDSELEQIKEVD